jgi:hypothetical protein
MLLMPRAAGGLAALTVDGIVEASGREEIDIIGRVKQGPGQRAAGGPFPGHTVFVRQGAGSSACRQAARAAKLALALP